MLVKNYAYTVATYVPHHQRQEIMKNVEEDIYDQLEGLYPQGNYSEADIENLLVSMGDPKLVAKSYTDEERYLIGPTYLPLYQRVLKIVLYTMVGAFIAIGLIEGFTTNASVAHIVSDVVSNIWINGLSGAVIVTLVFALLERRDNKWLEAHGKQSDWHISDLKKAPEANNSLKLSDPIGSIIVNIITLIALNQFKDYIAIGVINSGSIDYYPIISLEAMSHLLPLVNIVLLVGIGFNLVLIAKQAWNKQLRIIAIAFEVVSLILWMRIVTYPNLINIGFLETLLGSEAYNHLMEVSQYNIAIAIVIILFISGYEIFKHVRALRKR